MHRSDRLYLSKFELDPDPDYLDLEEFDLDYEICNDEFYEKIITGDKKSSAEIRRYRSNEN
jgi:hypothetical protein